LAVYEFEESDALLWALGEPYMDDPAYYANAGPLLFNDDYEALIERGVMQATH
jgi:hypothetical protein